MRETNQTPPSATITPPPPGAEHPARAAEGAHAPHANRLVRFGREHPALTVVGFAGAGLLGGLEMAAGVLLGAGVAALLGRPDGRAEAAREARGRIRRILDHLPHDLTARARAVVRAARGEITAPPRAEPASKPEAEAAPDPSG